MKEKDTAKKRGRHRKKKIATYKDRWPERIKGKETKKTSDARNKENRQEEKEREGETEIEKKKKKKKGMSMSMSLFLSLPCVLFLLSSLSLSLSFLKIYALRGYFFIDVRD